ncbi:hypothetical protein RCF98_00590 [Thiothrix lacustris]|uniref:Uncharacterized protein n=1 Tax=Thiothrix lacustris TaxID=525917 RepID=A0ABY9MQD6_9GAMM|nr:hypothetical protein [Thiothrix lacustris]WML90866.1 hypothetical protein RCF98_00590 [Thiothrix lacustris]
MKPPKLSGDGKYSVYALATRWTSYDCFLESFPRYLRMQGENGDIRALFDGAVGIVGGYIESGELSAVKLRDQSGILANGIIEYDISGHSVEVLERTHFKGLQEIGTSDDLQVDTSLDNPGGDHPMQEQYFLDEMKRRKIPNFLEVPDGERASLIRFFVNHKVMGESVARLAWQRLVDHKQVKSVVNTKKVKP